MDGVVIPLVLTIVLSVFVIESSLTSMIEVERNDALNFDMSEVAISTVPNDFKESLRVSYSEITDKAIKMFDIDLYGNIIICFENGSANVYDNNLEYKYSISYFSHQSSSIFFDNDMTAILLDRSDILVYLNEDNEILKTYKITNTFNNANTYQSIMNRRVISCDDYTYALERNLLEYKVIRIDSNGQSELVYSANSKFVNALKILGIIFVFIIVLVIIVAVIECKNIFYRLKKHKTEK